MDSEKDQKHLNEDDAVGAQRVVPSAQVGHGGHSKTRPWVPHAIGEHRAGGKRVITLRVRACVCLCVCVREREKRIGTVKAKKS